MANTKEMPQEAEVKAKEAPAPAKTAAPVPESVYTAAELADNCKVFGTYREIVLIALRQAGKETATLSEAKRIIEKFKNKEVK